MFNLGLVLFFGANDLKLVYKKYSKQLIHKFFPQYEENENSQIDDEPEAEKDGKEVVEEVKVEETVEDKVKRLIEEAEKREEVREAQEYVEQDPVLR